MAERKSAPKAAPKAAPKTAPTPAPAPPVPQEPSMPGHEVMRIAGMLEQDFVQPIQDFVRLVRASQTQQQALINFEGRIDSLRKQVENLQGQVGKLESTEKGLSKSIDALQKEQSSITNRVTGARTRLSSLQSQAKQIEADNARNKKHAEDAINATKRVAENQMESDRKKHEETVQSLTSKAAALTHDVKSLETRKTRLSKELGEIEGRVESGIARLQSLIDG